MEVECRKMFEMSKETAEKRTTKQASDQSRKKIDEENSENQGSRTRRLMKQNTAAGVTGISGRESAGPGASGSP
jgi:hypothetical protein